MKTLTFHAIIQIRGINPFILVDAARVNTLKPNWRKPLPIVLQINGKPATPSRTNMMPAGNGTFYLYLNGIVRGAARVSVGDKIRVKVTFDSAYKNGPQHPIPQWFNQALKNNPQAQKNWAALTPSRKKEILRYFAGLKSPEARARNLAKAIHVLSGHNGRFMARSWRNGS